MQQQSLGETIRRLRRQRSLTQTDLGGERFSKSYVSAVEREKIIPSYEALHFFAKQLDQPDDFFEKLLEQVEQTKQVAVSTENSVYDVRAHEAQKRIATFLDIALQEIEHTHFPLLQELSTFAPELITTLPLHRQAEYSFLMGLLLQEKGELSAALHAFERALPFAPEKQLPAILNALGFNYYLRQAYQVALEYYKRALSLLQEEDETSSRLHITIELNYGEAYRALSAHRQASEHFERARALLGPTHDVRTAGRIYLGLGYCTYAHTYQKMALNWQQSTSDEQVFQRAVSFLIQSRTLYQVSGDHTGSSLARITQARVLLDLWAQHRKIAQQQKKNAAASSPLYYESWLNEVEEQCHQILLEWQDLLTTSSSFSTEVESIVYSALAHLVRTHIERAILARLEDHTATAVRERAYAGYLCQQVLDTLTEPVFPWNVLKDSLTMQVNSITFQDQALPRLPDLSATAKPILRSPMSQAEIYFAAAEVAEELGRAATMPEYSSECYTLADQCLLASLHLMSQAIPSEEYDPSYLIRCYLRSVTLLEERLQFSPNMVEETWQTLFTIFKTVNTKEGHQL